MASANTIKIYAAKGHARTIREAASSYRFHPGRAPAPAMSVVQKDQLVEVNPKHAATGGRGPACLFPDPNWTTADVTPAICPYAFLFSGDS